MKYLIAITFVIGVLFLCAFKSDEPQCLMLQIDPSLAASNGGFVVSCNDKSILVIDGVSFPIQGVDYSDPNKAEFKLSDTLHVTLVRSGRDNPKLYVRQ